MSAVKSLQAKLSTKLGEMEAICADYGYEVTPTMLLRHSRGPSFSMVLGNDDLNTVVLCIAELGGIGEVVQDESQPETQTNSMNEFRLAGELFGHLFRELGFGDLTMRSIANGSIAFEWSFLAGSRRFHLRHDFLMCEFIDHQSIIELRAKDLAESWTRKAANAKSEVAIERDADIPF